MLATLLVVAARAPWAAARPLRAEARLAFKLDIPFIPPSLRDAIRRLPRLPSAHSPSAARPAGCRRRAGIAGSVAAARAAPGPDAGAAAARQPPPAATQDPRHDQVLAAGRLSSATAGTAPRCRLRAGPHRRKPPPACWTRRGRRARAITVSTAGKVQRVRYAKAPAGWGEAVP